MRKDKHGERGRAGRVASWRRGVAGSTRGRLERWAPDCRRGFVGGAGWRRS